MQRLFNLKSEVMKSVISLCIGFFILVGFASLDYRTLEVEIKENSTISIKGTSNVHSFECSYKEEIELFNNNIELLPNSNSFEIKKAKLHLTSKSFDCGGRRINSDFKDILQAEKFPHIDIKVNSITPHQTQYLADVEVHIAGHTKNYQLQVENPDKSHFTGDLIVDITDFGLESPKKMMGLIKVDQLIDINFDLYLNIKS